MTPEKFWEEYRKLHEYSDKMKLVEQYIRERRLQPKKKGEKK